MHSCGSERLTACTEALSDTLRAAKRSDSDDGVQLGSIASLSSSNMLIEGLRIRPIRNARFIGVILSFELLVLIAWYE